MGGWFEQRRNTALGIAAAGTGCGTLVIPPIAGALIERYGWRTTDIYIGIGAAVALAACAIVAERPPVSVASAKRHPLGRVVRSSEFVLLYVSSVLATTALFVPFVFIAPSARDHGASEVAAAALLSLIGGVSVVGRFGLGALGDRMGIVWLFKATVLVMGASYAIWLALPAYGWLVVFAIVFGFGYGARIALIPGVLIEFFGLDRLGAMLGVFFTSFGVAAVLGPLLAGMVVDYTGSYQWGIGLALAMGLAGFAAIVPLRERIGVRVGEPVMGQ